MNESEYIVSIRIPFPENLTNVIKLEKNRFVTEYQSSYKSDPHITLYLARYTKEGFQRLMQDLRELSLEPFSISLLDPKLIFNEGLHRNFYIIDVSNKEKLQELHAQILNVAAQYRSPLVRKKDQKRLEQGLYNDAERENLQLYGYAGVLDLFNPHITLGGIDIGSLQPELKEVKDNLKSIVGEKITVSELAIFFYETEADGKTKLIEELAIPFSVKD
jgi:2'-5' RNA ligase